MHMRACILIHEIKTTSGVRVLSKGKIVTWNDDKGYGFIEPFDGGKQVFMHISALGNRSRRPVAGDVVTYAVTRDDKGRRRAANANLAGTRRSSKPSQPGIGAALPMAFVFLAAVGGLAATGIVPGLVPMIYVVMSVVTFGAYAIDKSAAKRGTWRTSESTLLLLGLAGGWPGALLAQRSLRHKSRKPSFQAAFWITVVLNCAALAWLNTDAGLAFIDDQLM